MTYIPDDLYQTITNSMPIVCVDVVPVREVSNVWQIGIITRGTGREQGKPAILGGRVKHQETLDDAIKRHLSTDWEMNSFKLHNANTISTPFHVQQYFHQNSAEPPYGYDPTKHSIALTYLICLEEDPKPRNEALNFYWINEQEIPESTAYNQHLVMAKAFERLASTKQ